MMKLPYLTASCKCRTTLKWLRARANKKFSMGNKGWWPSLPLCIFTSNWRLTAVCFTQTKLWKAYVFQLASSLCLKEFLLGGAAGVPQLPCLPVHGLCNLFLSYQLWISFTLFERMDVGLPNSVKSVICGWAGSSGMESGAAKNS